MTNQGWIWWLKSLSPKAIWTIKCHCGPHGQFSLTKLVVFKELPGARQSQLGALLTAPERSPKAKWVTRAANSCRAWVAWSHRLLGLRSIDKALRDGLHGVIAMEQADRNPLSPRGIPRGLQEKNQQLSHTNILPGSSVTEPWCLLSLLAWDQLLQLSVKLLLSGWVGILTLC